MDTILDSQLLFLIIGAVLTLITSVIINKHSYKDSLNEMIAIERINAYKKIYNTVSKLGHSISTISGKEFPKECYVPYLQKGEQKIKIAYCFPEMFLNFDELHKYKNEIATVLNENRIYLNQSILNKTFLIDHYFGEVWHIAHGKTEDYIQNIGFILSSDIDKMRNDVETEIQEFFLTGKNKINRSNFEDPFYYAKNHLKKTELFSIIDDLNSGNSYGTFPSCQNCSYYKNCPVE